jgi:SAM-dependent methyltransferase
MAHQPTPNDARSPRLYGDLAGWFHLLTAPEDYAEEAEHYRETLTALSARPVRSVLELGSGGGNNASHLKRHFELTLVDRSPQMLAVSAGLNPECEHVAGDMRSVRLNRSFDAVFVHDAVSYLTTKDDLGDAMRTAFVHCEPGGVALFVPDEVRETFSPATRHGGHDGLPGDRRALRYVQWTWDPDPSDSTYLAEFAYLLREGGDVRLAGDRHVLGLFPRATWMGLLERAGFEPRHDQVDDEEGGEVFIGVRGR